MALGFSKYERCKSFTFNSLTIAKFESQQELYEPLWEDLLARSKQDGFRIRAIWIADCANQGASGVQNENIMGNESK
jgi:hypothetical protein